MKNKKIYISKKKEYAHLLRIFSRLVLWEILNTSPHSLYTFTFLLCNNFFSFKMTQISSSAFPHQTITLFLLFLPFLSSSSLIDIFFILKNKFPSCIRLSVMLGKKKNWEEDEVKGKKWRKWRKGKKRKKIKKK